MRYWRVVTACVIVAGVMTVANVALPDVVLETADLRLVIGDDGVCRSMTAKATGKEYLATEGRAAAFSATIGGKNFPASSVALSGDALTVQFGRNDATARMRVIRADHYIALRLESLSSGRPVEALNLLQLRIKPLRYLGPWINIAYDDEFGICLCGGNVKTNAAMSRSSKPGGPVELRATAYSDTGFEGATAVLFGVSDPKNKFLDAMAIVERDFEMPRGAENRRAPAMRYSYLWAYPTPQDIEEYVRIAKRAGFRMILYSYTAFTKGAGHFEWNSSYPNGMADLKKVADGVRKAGLAVGLHIHYSKAHKTDPYVTPIPDERLGTIARFTLAAAVDQLTSTITVNEHPRDCTLDEDRRILKIGKELVEYKSYTLIPPYQFLGCVRGALKTRASAHEANEEVAALDVDTWSSFIRFDQSSDIQDEAARRIANIIVQTGPYDMVYFDGAEDVPSPFWYHCANAQWRVFRLLRPAPPVCEAAANTHFSWHMITRSNAYDSVPAREMKEFCRKNPSRWAPLRALDFSRIEFGWLHGFGRNPRECITPDILEYVISRGAAWDCPFSLSVRLPELKVNPRVESCFDVIKTWEDARLSDKLADAHRGQLKNLDQEHHLFINEKGEYELVAINEITPAEKRDLFRAYSFRRENDARQTYVLIWANVKEVQIALPVEPRRVRAVRPFAKEISLAAKNGKAALTIGERTYLVFDAMQPTEAARIIQTASVLPVK